MTRSFMVMAIGAAILFAVQVLAEYRAAVFVNVPWVLSLVLLGVLLAVLGGTAYHVLRGNVLAKLVLIAAMVVIANGATQVVVGSDQAYPNLRLWLIVPYVVACWLGAGVAVGFTKWGPSSNPDR